MNKEQAWNEALIAIDDTGAVIPRIPFEDWLPLARLVVWQKKPFVCVIAVTHRDPGLRLGGEEAARLATAYLVSKDNRLAVLCTPIVL